MKTQTALTTTFAAVAAAFLIAAADARAQTPAWQPPTDAERCPSRWGAADERGSGNLMKPETVLRAAKLIRTGEVIELSHVLSPTMPFFGIRRFDVHIKRTVMNPGSNRRGSNEELVITELGQVGTQIDAFNHQTIGDSVYNCARMDDIATRTGFTKFGVEKIGTLMTRGVLIDVARAKGVDMLPDTYEITAADLQESLKRQNVTLQAGDAVFIYTGWSRLWEKDNPRYVRTDPGIGIGASEWLVKQNPMIIGSDNWSVEVVPNPDKGSSQPVHQLLLIVHGIHLMENVKLDELAGKAIYEFAFMVQPLKILGGTGSTVAPVAIR